MPYLQTCDGAWSRRAVSWWLHLWSFLFCFQLGKWSVFVAIYVGKLIMFCRHHLSNLLLRVEVVPKAGCGKLAWNLSSVVLCMVTGFDFSLPLIRFLGPSWGLLMGHCCVQRWWEQSGVKVGDLEVLYVWARQCLTLASRCELLGKEWKCKCRGRRQDRTSHLEHIHPTPHLFSMHFSHAPCHDIRLMWQICFSHLMDVRQSCNLGIWDQARHSRWLG